MTTAQEARRKAIRAEYAPYDRMMAFHMGASAYANVGSWSKHPYRGVAEQAYDRGLEFAMRCSREGV